MAKVIFRNPNEPEQPARGVYRWFYVDNGQEVTIYIGCAGTRANGLGTPSTLHRGVLEAKRSCISSDRGKLLDTDFIVGSALLFLKGKGHDCIWEHISDNPAEESQFCRRYKPLLQPDSANITRIFRLRKPGGQLWGTRDHALAQNLLFECFAQNLVDRQPTD
jgi:hypothetical protein